MAGQGHQFPGNFQGNAGAMRTGFGAGPMGGQMQGMPNQLGGKPSIDYFCLCALCRTLHSKMTWVWVPNRGKEKD